MSTIQHLNSAIDYHWKDLSRQFPAFERPQIVPAASIRKNARGYLSEKDETEMVGEALNGGASITQLLDDLLAAVGKNTPIWNDLMDIKDKYNLETVTVGLEESNISWGARAAIKDLRTAIDRIANGGIVFDGFKEEADALFDKYFGEWNMNESKKLGESVPFSQEDADDIADMFAGYSAGSLSGAGRSQLMGFMQMHGDELKKMASQASQSGGFGDFSRARDLGNDDLDESKAETASEIDEIIGEDDDRSDTEKGISEYEKVEDDVDEDDDELSESVIRHATMLAREIW